MFEENLPNFLIKISIQINKFMKQLFKGLIIYIFLVNIIGNTICNLIKMSSYSHLANSKKLKFHKQNIEDSKGMNQNTTFAEDPGSSELIQTDLKRVLKKKKKKSELQKLSRNPITI